MLQHEAPSCFGRILRRIFDVRNSNFNLNSGEGNGLRCRVFPKVCEGVGAGPKTRLNNQYKSRHFDSLILPYHKEARFTCDYR